MKITIACKYFSPRGGAQTFLFHFVRHLVADGHRVKIITMEVETDIQGIETQLVRLPPAPRAFRDLLFARAVGRLLAQDEADLIFGEQRAWGADVVRAGGGLQQEHMRQIVRSFPPGPARALRSLGKRLSLKEYLGLRIERRVYSHPNLRHVIAISSLVERGLLKCYPHLAGRTSVVYCGTNTERFTPEVKKHRIEVRAELKIPEDALVGAFVSYDLRRKGLPTALSALSIIKHKPASRPVYAIVVGGRRRWADNLTRRLDVVDRVRFVGKQDPARFFGASDLQFLPSYFDAFANVCLEGLACGLPLITSAQTGAHELLTPGVDGFYIDDASNAAQMAGFIEYFMDGERLRAASDAARKLALQHTAAHMFRQIMDVLTPIAEQQGYAVRRQT